DDAPGQTRSTNTFYSYQARRASGDRHHQVNNHFFTVTNATKEVFVSNANILLPYIKYWILIGD
nr:hypothetical protein [Tanacetum cinerariifolium]